MSYTNNNYVAKGMLPQLPTGNVANFWNNWSKAIAVNDGKRNFSLKTKDCHDQQAPFNENQETIIEITHEDHGVIINSRQKVVLFLNSRQNFVGNLESHRRR